MNCSASIVYSNSFLGLTSNHSETYTPTSTGVFRVTAAVNLVMTTPSSTQVGLQSTQVPGGVTVNGSNTEQTGAFSGSALVLAGVSGFDSLQVSALISGGTTGLDHYDLYITIEQLQ